MSKAYPTVSVRQYPTISIRQPWAGLIVLGFKDIENRTWAAPEHLIGKEILIHAGKQVDREVVAKGQSIEDAAAELVHRLSGRAFKNRVLKPEYRTTPERDSFLARVEKEPDAFKLGGIVGSAVMKSSKQLCLPKMPVTDISPWAWPHPEAWHWELKQARTRPFVPMAGRLRVFNVELSTPTNV